MTPRRIREIRKSTVVLTHPDAGAEEMYHAHKAALQAFPGRRVLIAGGWTVSGL